MTPTEQDNELQEAIYALDRLRGRIDPNLPRTGSVMARVDDIVALITADRKRVALEAELQVLTYLLDERTEHMFMQNPNTGEMTGNGWLCNTSLSAVSANRIEAERRKRIAKLKAQQEEV